MQLMDTPTPKALGLLTHQLVRMHSLWAHDHNDVVLVRARLVPELTFGRYCRVQLLSDRENFFRLR
jgi:hypothetical protein